MLTVGLTGGAGSGKSRVAEILQTFGVPVLDADQVSRDIVVPPSSVLDEIARVFGRDFLNADGTLHRRKLREHVFADADARRQLERITHPAIRERLRQWRDAQTAPYCVLSAAILLEAGLDALTDRVLAVDAPVEVQVARLMARDSIAEPLARQMIAAQMSRDERQRRAHDRLHNAGSMADLVALVERLHRQYLDRAGAK